MAIKDKRIQNFKKRVEIMFQQSKFVSSQLKRYSPKPLAAMVAALSVGITSTAGAQQWKR